VAAGSAATAAAGATAATADAGSDATLAPAERGELRDEPPGAGTAAVRARSRRIRRAEGSAQLEFAFTMAATILVYGQDEPPRMDF